jgi:hypothetical protein
MLRQVAVGLAAAAVISVTGMADERLEAGVRPALANVQDTLQTPEAGGTGGCEEFGCGTNSPVVDGAGIAEEPVQTPEAGGTGGCDEFGCGTNSPVVDGAGIAEEPVQAPETGGTGGCDEFGCGGNSPVVDGAAIADPTVSTSTR